MSGDGHEQRPSPRLRHECAQSLGLNPLRVCMSEQQTLSACVCKSAAAEITSDYDRAQAWHSCADQQPESVKKTRDRLRSAGYHSAVHVMAAEERPQMYDAFMSVHCMSACITRGTRHAMCRYCACRGRCELHAPSASCCVSPCLCARWSRLRSTRSQPSSFAADSAPANSGGGASARQTMEANKSAVGVAMQRLVMIDKLHDMHQRQVISDSDFARWSNWAREHVTSVCIM